VVCCRYCDYFDSLYLAIYMKHERQKHGLTMDSKEKIDLVRVCVRVLIILILTIDFIRKFNWSR